MLPEEIFLRKPAKAQLKKAVLLRCNGRCIYCGDRSTKLTVDHIHPRSKGGQDALYSLAPACVTCQALKGSGDVWEWWQSSDYWDGAIASGRVDLLNEILGDKRSLLEYLEQMLARSAQFRVRVD